MAIHVSNTQKKLIGYVCIVTLSIGIAAILIASNILSDLENSSWDWRLRQIAKASSADPAIKIIMIDQNALEQLAEEEQQFWPWPRELYVPIVEFLRRSGARGVAFDILFTEQSHYSVSDDQAFANSIKGEMPVIAAVALRQSDAKINSNRFQTFTDRQEQDIRSTEFAKSFLPFSNSRFPSATLPITEILDSATAFGNVSAANDSDGIFRHVLPGSFVQDVPILSLPFAFFHAVNPKAAPPPTALQREGKLAVRFAGPPHTYATYSFSSVLRSFQQLEEGVAPLVPLSEFKDSYVLVGMDAPGLLDLRPTPLSPSFPGVEYHATSLDNILHDSFIKTSSSFQNILFTAVFVMIASGGALFTQRARIQTSIIIPTFIFLVFCTYQLGIGGYWIQLIVPLLCTALAVLLAVAVQYQLEGYQFRFIKKAFRYYVSSDMVDKIIEDPSVLALGGEKKELSIFFCDIARFTSISESLEPSKLVSFLNTFLTEMTKIILEHGGTVDKYIGDAIVAFWNAPVPLSDHADRAIRAAVRCQQRTAELRPDFQAEYGQDLRIRIGVHTGIASVGNFGSVDRFNYTVIGDAANLAARLEGANKNFGTELLFSESARQGMQTKIAVAEIGHIRVVGRSEPLRVFSTATVLTDSEVSRWNEAVTFFSGGELEQAEKIFSTLPQNNMTSAYRERIKRDRASPTDSWTPIWNLIEK